MHYIADFEKKLRETSPRGYLAVEVFAGDYISKAKTFESTGREILQETGRALNGRPGEVYSDGVHKGADWGGKAAGAATAGLIMGAGALLGGLVGGPIGAALGAWLFSGVAGAIGGVIERTVGGAIEKIGRAAAGALGIDFHTHGTTPGGGTWRKTEYANGGWDREEIGPDFDVNESMSPDGDFSQEIIGKGPFAGYNSKYTEKGVVKHFEAVDLHGIFHNFNRDHNGFAWGSANSHDTDKSNGRDGKHVKTEGSDGSKSDLWFYPDGSSKESHTSPPHRNANGSVTTEETTVEKDKDGNTTRQTTVSTTTDDKGNTTTVETTTDSEGHSKTHTSSHDSKGNANHPPEPPPGNSGRDNPEGQGTEGPPVRPGEMGKGRPGHPFDLIVQPGSWQKDNGEWQGEQPPNYRDVLAGVILLLDPFQQTGHGDAADEQAKMEDLRRKLRGMEITSSASGEDFIHPKAKAAILNHMIRSVL
ncbi:MAG TPA: hypothetical protein DCF33_04235 [Saprospirales bacterium]|nr:hypothetical protein [Saprospirales bacterium]